jgi:hypothetical protein
LAKLYTEQFISHLTNAIFMTITRTFRSQLSLFFAIFCIVQFTELKAQNIPDANFAAAIRAVCPECIDAGNNLTYAALFITDLNVSNKNISNLTGVRGLSSLQNLNCSYNNLTTIPTLPSWLTCLACSNNLLTNLPALPVNLC